MSVRNKAPEYYRNKAAFCRAVEKSVTRPEIAQALQELATELEMTADRMERNIRKPRARPDADRCP